MYPYKICTSYANLAKREPLTLKCKGSPLCSTDEMGPLFGTQMQRV